MMQIQLFMQKKIINTCKKNEKKIFQTKILTASDLFIALQLFFSKSKFNKEFFETLKIVMCFLVSELRFFKVDVVGSKRPSARHSSEKAQAALLSHLTNVNRTNTYCCYFIKH